MTAAGSRFWLEGRGEWFPLPPPFPSLPFPAPSSAAQITWLGETEGKGVSNTKVLKRTVRIFYMTPVSGRNRCRSKAQDREERNEKSPGLREMLKPTKPGKWQRYPGTWKEPKQQQSSSLPSAAPKWNLGPISKLESCQTSQPRCWAVPAAFQTSQKCSSHNPQSKGDQSWDAGAVVHTGQCEVFWGQRVVRLPSLREGRGAP